MRIFIEPLDVMLFRDGKPFEAGESFGQGREDTSVLQDRSCSYSRARLAEGGIVRRHQAQASKAEVEHRTRGRADVQRVARFDQYHGEVVFPCGHADRGRPDEEVSC